MIAVEESSILAFQKMATYKGLYRLLSELHELECLHPGQYIYDIHSTKAHLQALYTEKYRAQRFLEEQGFVAEQPCAP